MLVWCGDLAPEVRDLLASCGYDDIDHWDADVGGVTPGEGACSSACCEVVDLIAFSLFTPLGWPSARLSSQWSYATAS